MRRIGKFRDPRFVLNTLQNPLCEVRTQAELIAAAQQALQPQLGADVIPTAPPPAALAPNDPASQHPEPLADPDPIQAAEPSPKLALDQAPDSVEIPAAPPVAAAPQSSPNHPAKPPANPRAAARPRARKSTGQRPKPAPRPKPKRRAKRPPAPANVISPDSAEKSAPRVVNRSSPPRVCIPEVVDLKRHMRKCDICRHPEREDIEEDFVNWRSSALIQEDYEIQNYRSIYRHALALGLYQRRRENLRFAAELLIEHAYHAQPKPDTILRAIHTCARINAHGDWTEAPSHLIFSRADYPAPPQPPELAPASAPRPQLPAPGDCSTDIANPPSLIDATAIRK